MFIPFYKLFIISLYVSLSPIQQVPISILSGSLVISSIDTNIWVANGVTKANTTQMQISAGDVALGATLTAVRITSTSTDTFDAGTINILYEG